MTHNTSTVALNASLILIYVIVSVSGLTLIKGASVVSVRFAAGLTLYVAGFGLFYLILNRLPLSVAFPVAAGSLMLGTQISGWYVLGESLTLRHCVGLLVTFLGITVMFTDQQTK